MKGVEECAGCDPERAWSQHVSARIPCIFSQIPSDLSSLSQLVSMESLKQQVRQSLRCLLQQCGRLVECLVGISYGAQMALYLLHFE